MAEMVTLPEAARRFGVGYDALRQAVYRGRVEAQKMGGTYLISVEEVREYAETYRERVLSPGQAQPADLAKG